MIDRDDKSMLGTKIIRCIQQSTLQRERAAIVCLLAKRCNMRGDCSYLQSERFYSFGRPEIQSFVGALAGKKAKRNFHNHKLVSRQRH